MLDAIYDILDWFSSGVYQLIVDAMAYMVIWITYAGIKATIFAVGFFWDVGNAMFEILEIQTMIDSFIENLDNQAVNLVAYLHGFDALALVLNAKITRYIMTFIGI